MKPPVLSAVMLVYNGEKHLREAIDSVLNQSFKEFEFIIINDGSTDGTHEIIKQYSDRRIRIINNLSNIGIPRSRNIGLKEAKGEFLAWCDCDDLNFPTRFEEQINFLKANKNFVVCGSWQLYSNGKRYLVHKTKRRPELVKAMLLFKPSIMNPTSMLRLSMIRENKLYYKPDLSIAEDHDLFLRCSMVLPLTNIQKTLVKYRASETSIIKKFKSKLEESDKMHNVVYVEALNYLGIATTASDLKHHSLICSEKKFDSFNEFESCYNWLITLKLKNRETNVYESKALDIVLANQFYIISKKASVFRLPTFTFYLKRCYKDFRYMPFSHLLKLAFLCNKK